MREELLKHVDTEHTLSWIQYYRNVAALGYRPVSLNVGHLFLDSLCKIFTQLGTGHYAYWSHRDNSCYWVTLDLYTELCCLVDFDLLDDFDPTVNLYCQVEIFDDEIIDNYTTKTILDCLEITQDYCTYDIKVDDDDKVKYVLTSQMYQHFIKIKKSMLDDNEQ